MHVLGIDIGGSGIKGALVDMNNGVLVTDRHRIATPRPATRDAVLDTIRELIGTFDWTGPVGFGFPGIIRDQVIASAVNLDNSWLGVNLSALVESEVGNKAFVVNDADAAGLAEMAYGAGVKLQGTVIVLTLGTGIGSGLFHNGVLIPNSELGHIELEGKSFEKRASGAVRDAEDLSWKDYARRLDPFLNHLEFLFSPSYFILGGGAGKKAGKFIEYLSVSAEILIAENKNRAGIIGAAAACYEVHGGNPADIQESGTGI